MSDALGLDAAFFETLRSHFHDAPFNRLLGLQVAPLGRGYARVDLPFKPELIGNSERQSLHGGALASVMDTAGGLAVWTHVGLEVRLATIDLRIDYLRPAGPRHLVTEARVLRVGNQIGVAEIKCFHPEAPHETLTTGIGVFNISRPTRG